MSSSFILKAGAFALAYAGVVSADKKYTCAAADKYEGSDFFDKFDFFSGLDPTRGYVQYQTKDVAQSTQFGGELVKITNNQAYIGVDYWNQYEPYGAGRPSIRLESKKIYNHGLFVLDVAHMPASVCGTWPAFWTYSDFNYPAQGEIDILENVHENTVGLNVLHTSSNFSVAGNQKGSVQSGSQSTYSCDDNAERSLYGSQYTGQGCQSTNADPNSYGSSLNAAGGAVYAMEWTSDVISVWNFAPGNIPIDLASGSPETSKWGLPTFTTTGGIGDIDSHFKDHKLVIDTTFCGNWAGQDSLWQATSCYDKDKYPTCSTYVAANPAKYSEAYWLINSVKVYQKTDANATFSDSPVSSTSTSASPTANSSPISLSTGVHYTNGSSITTPTLTGGDIPLTTSTVYTTKTGTVLSCAPTVTNCPLGAVTTETIALYTTICPISVEATPTPILTSADLPLTTSTIFSTKTGTVTACPASIKNCPFGSVTTEIIAISTTVCPGNGNTSVANITPTAAVPTTIAVPTSTAIPGSPSCGGVGIPACPQGNSAGVSPIPVKSSSSSSVGILELSAIASVPESAKPTSVSGNSGNSGSPGVPISAACGGAGCPESAKPTSVSGNSSNSESPGVSASAVCGGAGCPVAAKPTSVPGNSEFSAAASPSCVGEGCAGVAKPTSFVYAPTSSAGNGTAVGTGTLILGSITLPTVTAPITTNGSGALRVGTGFALVGLIAALVM